MNVENLSLVMMVAGICIGVVNIIVEVLKKAFMKSDAGVQMMVLIVSEMVSYFAFYVYCIIEKAEFSALMFFGALFCGFFIAYGAMFGYDNLYKKFADQIYVLQEKNEKDI